jgi:hypothetical protein
LTGRERQAPAAASAILDIDIIPLGRLEARLFTIVLTKPACESVESQSGEARAAVEGACHAGGELIGLGLVPWLKGARARIRARFEFALGPAAQFSTRSRAMIRRIRRYLSPVGCSVTAG